MWIQLFEKFERNLASTSSLALIKNTLGPLVHFSIVFGIFGLRMRIVSISILGFLKNASLSSSYNVLRLFFCINIFIKKKVKFIYKYFF